MSDTTKNWCRNILLKSVKMHFFLVIPKFWVFIKSTNLYDGVQNSFHLKKLVLLRLLRIVIDKKENEI